MTARSKKIFWGIIIASIHIKLWEILLFPACFGYALLYFGIYDFTRGTDKMAAPSADGKFLRIMAAALVIVSGLVEFLNVSQYLPNADVLQLLPFILEYIVLFHLMEVYTSLNPASAGFKTGYAVVMGLALMGFGISQIFSSGIWMTFSGVVILICRSMVLAAAWKDKKIAGVS